MVILTPGKDGPCRCSTRSSSRSWNTFLSSPDASFRVPILRAASDQQLGGGIEFADHREYVAGDDFRYLDWNVFARHDELLLKRFQEEEDLHVYILLDCLEEHGVGNPSKFDYARQVAAALAYIALADLDRVAIVAFSGQIVADLPLMRWEGTDPLAAQIP